MKIFYVTYSIRGKSGIERIILSKANYFSEHYKYDVNIITIDDYFEKSFYPIYKNVIHHDLKLRGQNFFSKSKSLSKVLKRQNPDVVLVGMDNFGAAFFPILFRVKFPMILERHSIIINNFGVEKSKISKLKNSIKLFLMRLGVRSYHKLVVLSVGEVDEWTGVKNIIVIPNPLTFYPKEKAALENKTVLAVGRLDYQKGFDILLKIWSRVSGKFPAWQLNIYGDGIENDNLKRIIKELDLTKTVNLCPPTKNIQDVYLHSSIFALSSRSEGFGLVLVEAMSCGLPVVSFECPNGPKDIISHEEDGFLIKPNDIETFAEKLNYLMADKELRKKIGDSGRNNITRLNSKTIMSQWDSLIKNLISKN